MIYDEDEAKLIELCGFNVEKEKHNDRYSGRTYYSYKYSGSFSPPDNDIYLEITSKPARAGSIGRLVGLDVEKWSKKYLIYFDEKKKTLEFDTRDLRWVKDHPGPTVYKYVTKKREQQNLEPITNKFGQTLQIDDLVVGVGGTVGHVEIVFGYVSRWTIAGTLFLKPYGPFGRITNQAKGDVKIKDSMQTIRLPKEAELEKDLFSVVLSADYGKGQ